MSQKVASKNMVNQLEQSEDNMHLFLGQKLQLAQRVLIKTDKILGLE
jgi:hypothetical protein